MELLGVLVVLALLSVPIMLVVTLAKVSDLERQISELARKLTTTGLTRSCGAAENVASRDAPAPKASGWLSAQRELLTKRGYQPGTWWTAGFSQCRPLY